MRRPHNGCPQNDTTRRDDNDNKDDDSDGDVDTHDATWTIKMTTAMATWTVSHRRHDDDMTTRRYDGGSGDHDATAARTTHDADCFTS